MKLLEIEELARVIQVLKNQGKKIVQCHGVFDILHIGHIRHLEEAKQWGDILIVTITPDRFAAKGDERPVFNESFRAQTVTSLHFVDYVSIIREPDAAEAIRLLKPHIFVRGSSLRDQNIESSRHMEKENEAIKEICATLIYTDDIEFSSTNIINRFFSNISEEIKEYLKVFRQRYKNDDLFHILDRMEGFNVLVIGDTILDEYQYCEAIGKSSKDPVLALRYQSHDLFAGGVLAVANHVANFAGKVKLVTVIGEKDSHEEFIRTQLRPNIDPHLIVQENAPTLIKRRFIEGYSLNKLFEVYVMDNKGLSKKKTYELCEWIKSIISRYDIVIAADFGHGAISDDVIDVLVEYSPFLAVNTQANAGNRGFNTISKYKKADYVCLAEHEIRLEARSIDGDLRQITEKIAERLKCKYFVVTRGRRGALIRSERGSFIEVPAFAQNIVDRIGAGDAFFAVTSMVALQSVNPELLGFIGNAVGSLAVEIIGNKKSIDKESTKRTIKNLLEYR